jgi:hypothetical protein
MFCRHHRSHRFVVNPDAINTNENEETECSEQEN